MNGEKLYDAIGAVDDRYLVGLEIGGRKSRRILPVHFTAGLAAAACFCVIAAGALILPKLTGGPVVSPVTSVSDTSISGTTPPETSAPDTSAPETSAPDTSAPDTSAPETSVPDTSAPETSAPDASAPDTSAPDTSAPETSAPDTSAPDTSAPETTVPAIVSDTYDSEGAVTNDDDKPDDPLPDDDGMPLGGGRVELAYGRPILPLTLLEEDGDITAKRKTTFDYSEWDVEDMYPDVGITDEYVLTNSSSEDKEVTLVYPFSGNGYLYDRAKPTITVNGEAVEETVRAGSLPEDHLNLNSRERYYYGLYGYDRYKELLSDGTYMERALNYTFDYGDRPITVYKFTKETIDGENKPKTGGKTGVSFDYDPEKTKVVLHGFNSNPYNDRETGRQFWIVGDPAYIIVSGEDITDIVYDYNHFKKKTDDDEQTDPENMPKFVRYETDYDHIMREILKKMWDYDNSDKYKYFPIDFEYFYLAYCEYLESKGAFSGGSEYCDQLYDCHGLSGDFNHNERIFYSMMKVTIPAGGSVTFAASVKNHVQTDFCSLMVGSIHSYDIATSLGSNLEFTEISAEITNYSSLDVTDENFGFDLENGVDEAELDPDTGRYYIEAKKKYPERP